MPPGHGGAGSDDRRRGSGNRQARLDQGVRQRRADRRRRATGLDFQVARRGSAGTERRPLLDPRPREEPGVLADRHRCPRRRDRPQRRRVHPLQEPRAQAAGRRRRLGRPGHRPGGNQGRTSAVAVVSRLRVCPRSHSCLRGALRVVAIDVQPGPRQPRRTRPGRTGHRELLSALRRARTARAHAAAVRRRRARPASRRRPQRRAVATRIQQRPRHCRQDDSSRCVSHDRGGCGGSSLPRVGCQLRC